ncbi:hypothetical protein BCN_P042 (plasmid) [Bacillus cereus NC7401]|nr:hypothetical protein BCN_P042 [Bacillus cereus NC7401]
MILIALYIFNPVNKNFFTYFSNQVNSNRLIIHILFRLGYYF